MTEIDPLGLVTVPGSIYANHSVNVMVEDNYISVYGNHSATFNFVYSFDSEGHLSPNSGYQNLSAIPWPTTAIHSYGLGSEGYGYTSTYTITVEVNNQYGVHAFDEWYQDIYQVTARMSLTVVYFKVDENGGHYGHQTILYLADCGPYSGNYSLRIEGSLYEE